MSSKQNDDHEGLSALSADSHEIEKYYDDWAADYESILATWDYEAPQKAAETLRHHLEPDSIILDAGCGTGLTGKALAAVGFTTFDGIDLSSASLKQAARHNLYRTLTQVNMQERPFPIEDNRYDGLECVGVLTYLPDSVETFREFCRLVRPGGLIVLTQRTDLFDERDYPAVLQTLAAEGSWQVLEVSEPRPYLPNHAEFADRILVRYITCQVS